MSIELLDWEKKGKRIIQIMDKKKKENGDY